MQLKVEHTVDLKDIPDDLKDTLESVSSELCKLSHYVESIAADIEQDNVGVVIARLDRSRRRLFQCDQRLSDCDQIVKTYTKAISELHAEQTATNPPEENE